MNAKAASLVLAVGLVLLTSGAAAATSGPLDGAQAPCEIHQHAKDTKIGTIPYPHLHCSYPGPGATCEIHQHALDTPVGTVDYPHLHPDSCEVEGLPSAPV